VASLFWKSPVVSVRVWKEDLSTCVEAGVFEASEDRSQVYMRCTGTVKRVLEGESLIVGRKSALLSLLNVLELMVTSQTVG